ncbi:hypothetical protein C8J56DRAFT_894852 [Mycena floridula]|nr:hypothetical protein C8J56DRAFT_894852 [Mycena floridula]
MSLPGSVALIGCHSPRYQNLTGDWAHQETNTWQDSGPIAKVGLILSNIRLHLVHRYVLWEARRCLCRRRRPLRQALDVTEFEKSFKIFHEQIATGPFQGVHQYLSLNALKLKVLTNNADMSQLQMFQVEWVCPDPMPPDGDHGVLVENRPDVAQLETRAPPGTVQNPAHEEKNLQSLKKADKNVKSREKNLAAKIKKDTKAVGLVIRKKGAVSRENNELKKLKAKDSKIKKKEHKVGKKVKGDIEALKVLDEVGFLMEALRFTLQLNTHDQNAPHTAGALIGTGEGFARLTVNTYYSQVQEGFNPSGLIELQRRVQRGCKIPVVWTAPRVHSKHIQANDIALGSFLADGETLLTFSKDGFIRLISPGESEPWTADLMPLNNRPSRPDIVALTSHQGHQLAVIGRASWDDFLSQILVYRVNFAFGASPLELIRSFYPPGMPRDRNLTAGFGLVAFALQCPPAIYTTSVYIQTALPSNDGAVRHAEMSLPVRIFPRHSSITLLSSNLLLIANHQGLNVYDIPPLVFDIHKMAVPVKVQPRLTLSVDRETMTWQWRYHRVGPVSYDPDRDTYRAVIATNIQARVVEISSTSILWTGQRMKFPQYIKYLSIGRRFGLFTRRETMTSETPIAQLFRLPDGEHSHDGGTEEAIVSAALLDLSLPQDADWVAFDERSGRILISQKDGQGLIVETVT